MIADDIVDCCCRAGTVAGAMVIAFDLDHDLVPGLYLGRVLVPDLVLALVLCLVLFLVRVHVPAIVTVNENESGIANVSFALDCDFGSGTWI